MDYDVNAERPLAPLDYTCTSLPDSACTATSLHSLHWNPVVKESEKALAVHLGFKTEEEGKGRAVA